MEPNAFGEFGYWGRHTDLDAGLANQLEELGYDAIWIGGSPPDDLELAGEVLNATERVIVATGVVNLWRCDPAVLAASYLRLEETHPGRFVLGIGVGHPESVGNWSPHPLEAMNTFLDRLDDRGVPKDRRLLAALGPKMLRLSAERSLGAHPYMTTAIHTRSAREVLGPSALLAPEQRVVVEPDNDLARELGRRFVSRYLALANYRRNLISMGYREEDLDEGGADVVDSLAPAGGPDQLADAIRSHHVAGADHVCVQVLVGDGTDPLDAHRVVTRSLGLSR